MSVVYISPFNIPDLLIYCAILCSVLFTFVCQMILDFKKSTRIKPTESNTSVAVFLKKNTQVWLPADSDAYRDSPLPKEAALFWRSLPRSLPLHLYVQLKRINFYADATHIVALDSCDAFCLSLESNVCTNISAIYIPDCWNLFRKIKTKHQNH